MRLKRARIRDYRSIHDSGWFEIEGNKTILVGPNEAGKTAVLWALENVNATKGRGGFDWLRDYPRSRLNDIQKGRVKPSDVTVVEVVFQLGPEEREQLAKLHPRLASVEEYSVGRKLDNTRWHRLEGVPSWNYYREVKADLKSLREYFASKGEEGLVEGLDQLSAQWSDNTSLGRKEFQAMAAYLQTASAKVAEGGEHEKNAHQRLVEQGSLVEARESALAELVKRIPLFVYFHNYFQVKPSIHLRHLANRIGSGDLDDEAYDFGNICLLSLLGFTADELAQLGERAEPGPGEAKALQEYKDMLDRRHYSLNSAQVMLTEEIQEVWLAEEEEERLRLRLHADRQYLKVVVEDELGVEVELDQRSAGFQWLVSFFVVFRAQAEDEYSNAILLLDEPGLSLHGLKQRQFRKTVSKIGELNQTIYSTHSPFMVGPDELPIVRVVEMKDRKTGTRVHTKVIADDPRSLFPLQEALGYDLAQSLFAQQRNLICEGLTDYWYIDGMAHLLREGNVADLNQKIALVPAGTAAKVVYFATILHAQKLKVAAILDSDQAGEHAAPRIPLSPPSGRGLSSGRRTSMLVS